ncbi:MAG: hypothetical protein NT133_17935 [Alphaproteobacteria bacterium]|nr:hypothetical protein [Alphaproteobacteria bacterium]
MTLLLAWGVAILQLLLLPPAALLAAGLAETLRARLLGMRGPGLLMPFRAIAAALGRQRVRGPDASLVSVIGPALVLTATLAAACLVPSFSRDSALAGIGDALTIAGLLTLARLIALLLDGAAADPAALFAEPAVLIAIFSGLVPGANAAAPIGLAALAIGALALVPGPRMARTASGRDLAMLTLAAALRRLVFLSLIADRLRPNLPEGAEYWAIGFALWVAMVVAITLVCTVAEAALPARLPARRREALAAGLALAALAVLVGLAEAAS